MSSHYPRGASITALKHLIGPFLLRTGTRIIRLVILSMPLACLFTSPSASAQAGWTGQARVIELIPTSRHYYEIHLDAARNPSGCRKDDWYYLNYEATGATQMFELFVESLKSGLRLRVYVTGVCNLNGYSEISAVGARAK